MIAFVSKSTRLVLTANELINNGTKQELIINKERFEGPVGDYCMHRSIAGHNPYNLFILTIVYSKNLPTS